MKVLEKTQSSKYNLQLEGLIVLHFPYIVLTHLPYLSPYFITAY